MAKSLVLKLDLSKFFNDERKNSLVFVDPTWKNVAELQKRIEMLFDLKNVNFLTNDNYYAPLQEPIEIIASAEYLKAFRFDNASNSTDLPVKKKKKRTLSEEQSFCCSTPRDAKRPKKMANKSSEITSTNEMNADLWDVYQVDVNNVAIEKPKSHTHKHEKSACNKTSESIVVQNPSLVRSSKNESKNNTTTLKSTKHKVIANVTLPKNNKLNDQDKSAKKNATKINMEEEKPRESKKNKKESFALQLKIKENQNGTKSNSHIYFNELSMVEDDSNETANDHTSSIDKMPTNKLIFKCPLTKLDQKKARVFNLKSKNSSPIAILEQIVLPKMPALTPRNDVALIATSKPAPERSGEAPIAITKESLMTTKEVPLKTTMEAPLVAPKETSAIATKESESIGTKVATPEEIKVASSEAPKVAAKEDIKTPEIVELNTLCNEKEQTLLSSRLTYNATKAVDKSTKEFSEDSSIMLLDDTTLDDTNCMDLETSENPNDEVSENKENENHNTTLDDTDVLLPLNDVPAFNSDTQEKSRADGNTSNSIEMLLKQTVPLTDIPEPMDTLLFKLPLKKTKNEANGLGGTTDYIAGDCVYINRRTKILKIKLLDFPAAAESQLKQYSTNLDDSKDNLIHINIKLNDMIEPKVIPSWVNDSELIDI